MTSEALRLLTFLYVAVLADQDTARIIDALKVLVPAVAAGVAGWYAKRREDARWEARQDVAERAKLNDGWGQLTAQSREIIDRLQVETAKAQAQCAASEEHEKKMAHELEEMKRLRALDLEEIEELKERLRRRNRETGERTRPKG